MERISIWSARRFLAAVLLASCTCACSEARQQAGAPTSVAAVAADAGGARVTTLNMRDQPAVSPGTDCPTGPIAQFELNPTSPAPARVIPQGLRPTDKDTIRGYVIEVARRNDEREETMIFGERVRHEPVRSFFVPLLDEQALDAFFVTGTYYARGKHVCRGGGEGQWTFTNFGV